MHSVLAACLELLERALAFRLGSFSELGVCCWLLCTLPASKKWAQNVPSFVSLGGFKTCANWCENQMWAVFQKCLEFSHLSTRISCLWYHVYCSSIRKCSGVGLIGRWVLNLLHTGLVGSFKKWINRMHSKMALCLIGGNSLSGLFLFSFTRISVCFTILFCLSSLSSLVVSLYKCLGFSLFAGLKRCIDVGFASWKTKGNIQKHAQDGSNRFSE